MRQIMAIVNATPDSFSSTAADATLESQLQRVRDIASAGVELIDIGGQSAITGVPEISCEEEIRRIRPVMEEALKQNLRISVDTYRYDVATAALDLGAHIINDISGLADPRVAEVVAAHGAGYVLMHNRGRPKQRLTDPALYTDVVSEVVDFWNDRVELLESIGVSRSNLILDFGPDFSKTPRQTLECLRQLHSFTRLDMPLLFAISRKDVLGVISGRAPRDRDAASLALLVALSARAPRAIFRMHDYRGAMDALRVLDYLEGVREIGNDDVLSRDLWRTS